MKDNNLNNRIINVIVFIMVAILIAMLIMYGYMWIKSKDCFILLAALATIFSALINIYFIRKEKSK